MRTNLDIVGNYINETSGIIRELRDGLQDGSTGNKFAIVSKNGTVVKTGYSQIIQPQVMYKENEIKWLDDDKIK